MSTPMTDITMPRLSDSMEQGTILSWLIGDGDRVAVGDELVEIEADKATVTHAATGDGILEILAAEGVTVAVGQPIARVTTQAASVAAPRSTARPAPADPEPSVLPTPSGMHRNERSAATPLARRAARRHGVAIDGLAGTGPRGRVVRADVLAAAGVADAPRPPAPEAATAAPERRAAACGSRAVEPTRMQQVVARRMVEALTTVPTFQVQTEVLADAAVALRAELKAAAQGEAVPSLNDLVVKAVALALRAHPRANGSYRDGRFVLHEHVNVGVAVAAADALVVPTIRDADMKSLGEIARSTRDVAGRVRGGEIRPEDLDAGTFTVSNLGMFGMTAITPVVNAPQAAILGVGALREDLRRVDGEIVDRSVVTLTLSCDHRILYGADAARFLSDVRALIEAPLRLAL
jgi:pyruvate dehydrogenase E2 component (dihydrolipoamide acetyltransferase)